MINSRNSKPGAKFPFRDGKQNPTAYNVTFRTLIFFSVRKLKEATEGTNFASFQT